jgi:hypothetical protein
MKAQLMLTAGLAVAQRAASAYWQKILGEELSLIERRVAAVGAPKTEPEPVNSRI